MGCSLLKINERNKVGNKLYAADLVCSCSWCPHNHPSHPGLSETASFLCGWLKATPACGLIWDPCSGPQRLLLAAPSLISSHRDLSSARPEDSGPSADSHSAPGIASQCQMAKQLWQEPCQAPLPPLPPLELQKKAEGPAELFQWEQTSGCPAFPRHGGHPHGSQLPSAPLW